MILLLMYSRTFLSGGIDPVRQAFLPPPPPQQQQQKNCRGGRVGIVISWHGMPACLHSVHSLGGSSVNKLTGLQVFQSCAAPSRVACAVSFSQVMRHNMHVHGILTL